MVSCQAKELFSTQLKPRTARQQCRKSLHLPRAPRLSRFRVSGAFPTPDSARRARGTSLRTGPTEAEPQPGRQPPQHRPDKTRFPHRSPTPFPAEVSLLLRPPLTRRSGLMPGREAGGAAATYQPRPWSGPTHGRPRRGRPRSHRRTAGRRGRSPPADPAAFSHLPPV